jgi:hypothetical protein
MDLYIHSPIRLRDVELSLLSRGTTLLFSCSVERENYLHVMNWKRYDLSNGASRFLFAGTKRIHEKSQATQPASW